MAEDKALEKEERMLTDASRWLQRDFINFAREERFAVSFASALSLYWNNYYTIENADKMNQNEAFRFFDWYVLDYLPEDQPRLIDTYQQEQSADLTSQQQQALDMWVQAPPAAAYELLDYDGQLLQVRDFVSGEEYEIYEAGGAGPVQPGDLLLGRLISLHDQLKFSTVAAYIPQDEIADLSLKLEAAKEDDSNDYPNSTEQEFMRRKGYLIIHHALEQSELKERPPVAAMDIGRGDKLKLRAAEGMRKLQEHL
jgi:hypothetical protein